MPGGSAPKRKGYRHERRITDMATDSGLDAKRAWGSNGLAMDWHPEVDVMVDGVKIQAKARKSIAAYTIPTENVDAVAIHADFGEDLLVVRYSDWLDMRRQILELKQRAEQRNTPDVEMVARAIRKGST